VNFKRLEKNTILVLSFFVATIKFSKLLSIFHFKNIKQLKPVQQSVSPLILEELFHQGRVQLHTEYASVRTFFCKQYAREYAEN